MPEPQQDTQPQMSAQEFAAAIRAKYPRVYDNLSDTDLTGRILEKHPEYRSVTGLDDPNGNYDFGELGKVQGARANGRPATRKEAYEQQAKNRGFAQAIGEKTQSNRQDVHSFIHSMTDTDEATKGYLGDLAQMLVLGGASKLGQVGRFAKAPVASSVARKMMPESMGFTPKDIAAYRGRELMPAVEGPTRPLEELTSPTTFQKFGENRHLPVSGPDTGPHELPIQMGTTVAVPRKPVSTTKPILSPLDAAARREAATAAMRSPTETMEGAKAAADFEGAAETTPEERRAQGEAFERERQGRFEATRRARAAADFEGAEPVTAEEMERGQRNYEVMRHDAGARAAADFEGAEPVTQEDIGRGQRAYEVMRHNAGARAAADFEGAEPAVPEMRPPGGLRPGAGGKERADFEREQPQMVSPELPAGATTSDVYKDPATGSWTDERSALHDRTIDKTLAGHTPAPADRQPVIWVLGGGTASGKTTISRQLMTEDPNLVRLDPDEMKLAIPEYEGLKTSDPQKASFRVHDESSYLNKKALTEALARRLDVIYDTTTSGDPASKVGLIQRLKAHGYKVNLAFADVPVETAIERSEYRALHSPDPINRGRFVPHNIIRQIHSEVARNFEAFKDAADAAYLYENSRSEAQGGPQLVYSREGTAPETVHIPELYERFKQKGASLAAQATKAEPATAIDRMGGPGSVQDASGPGRIRPPAGGSEEEARPTDLNPYYGKTRQIGMEAPSDLPANRRQLFGPTASTAPNPTLPRQNVALVPKMGMTKEDLAFQDANTEDILTASIGQQRMGMRAPRPGPTLVVRPQQVVQGSSVSKPMAAAELKPGDAGYVRTSELAIDPKRFQYKAAGDEGVTNLLKDVRKFDPEKAGVIQVWRDPQDGKMYVVNGHHRFELAKRTGTPSLLVKHIDAGTAAEARAIGAATNIAEGRGSATDAAKFFRDTNFTPADLAKQGLSLGEGKVAEGLALSKLDPKIFEKVATGEIPEKRGVIIGNATADGAQQQGIVDLIRRAEAKGKRLSSDTIREMARDVVQTASRVETTEDLFGAHSQVFSNAVEKAEIAADIKSRLSSEKRIFGAVASEKRAQALGTIEGQTIQAEKNRAISLQAAQAIEMFDKLRGYKGPIDNILEQAAKDSAAGNKREAMAKAYQQVRAELQLEASNERLRTEKPELRAEGRRPISRMGEGPTLPGMESHVEAQKEAAAAAEGEELSRRLVAPAKSISSAAGELERGSDLFRGAEAGGQAEMFGKIAPMGVVERKRKAK